MAILNPDHEPLNGVFTAIKPKKTKIKIGVKGGAHSGNWGHAGRPGKEGGSLPKGGSGGAGGVGAAAGIKPGQTPTNLKFQPPTGAKLPEHKPGDESGLADYKAWYQAQVAAGQTPSLAQAIQMRQYLAERAGQLEQQAAEAKAAAAEAAANTPEAKAAAAAAAAEEAKKKAELAAKVAAAKKKKGKGGGAKKKAAAEKKPKAGKGGKPKEDKGPAWMKGIVGPAVMEGTKVPAPKHGVDPADELKQWMDNLPDVAKLNDTDKKQAYEYFSKRGAAFAKVAETALDKVYVPPRPYAMVAKQIVMPSDQVIQSVLNATSVPAANPGKQLWDYLQSLPPKELESWKSWYDDYKQALHEREVLGARGGTKEQRRIVIHVGLKGSSTSGNWGHAGRPGKLGGSLPRSSAMSINTGRDWQTRQQVKLTLAKRQFPENGFPTGQAAQDWANAAYPGTEFNLAAGGHTVINPTLQAYNQVAQKFPSVASQIKSVNVTGNTPSESIATISRDGKLSLSGDWYSKANAPELREATREAVKAGFYPAGAGVQHYLLHTFGQAVLNNYANNPAANAKLVTWLNANFSKARSVSIFAMTGKNEFFGELFGAAFGTKSKVPVVNDFRNMLEQLS